MTADELDGEQVPIDDPHPDAANPRTVAEAKLAAAMKHGAKATLVPVASLHEAEWNPRKAKDPRVDNLCEAIVADPGFLWDRPVLALPDGTIYAGNLRHRAVTILGWEMVPAIIEDIPEQLAKERALRDNQQWGDWEEDGLPAFLESLRLSGTDLSLLGFEDRELQQLLDRLSYAGGGDPEAIPELPAEPLTRPGDLWELGRHRVLCADSTDPAALARVAGDETAACIWTDPPYGVEYEGGTRDRLTITNDHAETIGGLLEGAFAAVDPVLAPGAAIYVAHPAGPLSLTFGERFVAQGWQFRQTLVWVKDSLVVGHSDYHYRHEPILYGVKPGKGRRGRGAGGWYGGNDASSVFEVPRPKASPDHPTSKPVALVEAMVRNSTRSNEIVLDPFLGSGSTLIASEVLGRRCLGVDVDPRYVDVAVRRWESFTGQTARREE